MYYSPEIKSSPVFIGVTEHPTFIVGQNIGHEPDGTHTGVVWEKNRSAELLWKAIDQTDNLYLTNACNYTEMTPKHVVEGYEDLQDAIIALNPKKIICLGREARNMINLLKESLFYYSFDNIDIQYFLHPSYILRMNLDQRKYINSIKEVLA